MAQLHQLGIALLSGLGYAFCYDLYRGMLLRKRQLRRQLWLQDLLFGLSLILLALLLWFGLTDGSLRLSVFLWMSLGVLLYRTLLAPFLHTERWFKRHGKTHKGQHTQSKRQGNSRKAANSAKAQTPRKESKQRQRKSSHRPWNVSLAEKALSTTFRMKQKLKRPKGAKEEEKI